MRFLLINPERLAQPPFGLLYIGAVLEKEAHQVKVIEIPFDVEAKKLGLLIDKEIENYLPDVIGLTFMTPQAEISRQIICHVKHKFKTVNIIAGGVHPTLMYDEVISWGADLVCVGEGEETIKDIAKALAGRSDYGDIKGIAYRKDGSVVTTSPRPFIRDLDKIPFPAYHLITDKRFARRAYAIRGLWLKCGLVMTARGCPARCTFCCGKVVHGRVIREFGIPRVLDEVCWLKKTYKIEGLWIIDDTFSLKEDRVVEFCNGLVGKKISLKWACQARVDTFTPPMAKAMRRAGCVQIDFGVESGSQRVLDSLHKGISILQTKKAFRICRDNGIRPVATVMIGSPGETKQDIELTKELLSQIKPAFVGCFFSTPFPGTELYEMAVKNRWIDITKPIHWQTMESPVMAATLTAHELKKEYDELQKYNKNSMLNYMLTPLFIYDLLGLSLKNAKYFIKLLYSLILGRKRDAINTFLFIYRKEFLN